MEKVFELFPALEARRHLKGGVLSGGERQMLSLGMSLMLSPKLFLIDEPSGGLSPLYVDKDMIIVAAEEGSKGIGRIRLRRIPDTTRISLHGFIEQAIEPGSTVRTDGLNAYLGLKGYVHDRRVQRRQPKGEHLLPLVHLVVSLLKRWLLGTHQGAIGHDYLDYLDYYLDEFTFRFNRRKSASRGKLFYGLVQHAVQISPVPYDTIIKPRALGGG